MATAFFTSRCLIMQGQVDYIEITINEFDKEFLRFCEEYQEYECF